MSKITDETRRLIAEEMVGVPFQHIANKYGVSWFFVRQVRQKAGCLDKPGSGTRSGNHYTKKTSRKTAIERVAPEIVVSGPSPLRHSYERVIDRLEQQVALYTQALEVVRGLRDAAE